MQKKVKFNTLTHNRNFHFYADDTQLYVTFKTSCPDNMDHIKSMLMACVHDIDTWMLCNKMKMNKDKNDGSTDNIFLAQTLASIALCDETVSCSSNVHNIGVIFD